MWQGSGMRKEFPIFFCRAREFFRPIRPLYMGLPQNSWVDLAVRQCNLGCTKQFRFLAACASPSWEIQVPVPLLYCRASLSTDKIREEAPVLLVAPLQINRPTDSVEEPFSQQGTQAMIHSHTARKISTRLLTQSLGSAVRRLREYRTTGHDYWVRC